MLLGKNLCGRHDAGLIAVPHCDQSGKHSDHCLARTHIPLKKPVHLSAAHHVRTDFLYHALLGTCKFVWQSTVASIESRADLRHRNPDRGTAADIFLLQQRQLQKEQFLPFETVPGLLKSVLVGREMDIPDSEPQRGKAFFPENIFRQGLTYISDRKIDRLGHQPVHHLAGNPAIAKLVGRVIYSREDS